MRQRAHIAFLSESSNPLALQENADADEQNIYTRELNRHLGQLSYQIDIFTRRDQPDRPTIVDLAPGVRVVHIDAGPQIYYPESALWPFMPEFARNCLQFMQQATSPYQLIHSNSWLSGRVACWLRQHLMIPVVHIFHMREKTREHQEEMDDHSIERITVETATIDEVDSLIARYPAEQLKLITDYAINPHKITVIPSAVDTWLFRPVPQKEARRFLKLTQDNFIVTYVGQIRPCQDICNIIHALALLIQQCSDLPSLPRITLLLVGGETEQPDPELTPEIKTLLNLATHLGIEKHLHFAGKQQQEILRYYYSASNVIVTTPWDGQSGRTILEGMACGRPVIGSAVGEIASTIIDCDTGFLVPPHDPQRLATRLLQLLDPHLRERMNRAARERVEEEFTWSRVAKGTAALYERLLQIKGETALTSKQL